MAEAPVEQELLAGVAARVRPVIPYDAAAWLTMDPTTHLFTDGVIETFQPAICAPWFHNELVVDDFCKFRDLASSRTRVGILHDVGVQIPPRRFLEEMSVLISQGNVIRRDIATRVVLRFHPCAG